jgi:hypothetical protein
VGQFRGRSGGHAAAFPAGACGGAVSKGSISKRFFLKKEAKTPARLSPTTPRQPCKSFLVPFFKKELLS